MITINIDKAKELKKESLRIERAPVLTKLDIEVQRAMEQGQDVSDIVAKKQLLRDVTTAVDTATSVEQLKAITLPNVGV